MESLHVLPFEKVFGVLKPNQGIWHQDVVVQTLLGDIEGLHEFCVGVGLDVCWIAIVVCAGPSDILEDSQEGPS